MIMLKLLFLTLSKDDYTWSIWLKCQLKLFHLNSRRSENLSA